MIGRRLMDPELKRERRHRLVERCVFLTIIAAVLCVAFFSDWWSWGFKP